MSPTTSVMLECPKRCHTYIWMHNDEEYSRFLLKDVPFLHVSLKFGRRRGGFYCCHCTSSPPHEQCCFGVASESFDLLNLGLWLARSFPSVLWMLNFAKGRGSQFVLMCTHDLAIHPTVFPTVKHFSMRQLQVENGSRHNIEGVHFHSPIEIKCSVSGYPWPTLTISGPTDTASRLIANSSQDNDPDIYFRSVTVRIPADKVTSVFSGNFSCVGEITIVQDRNLQEALESVPKIHKLIIYGKNLWQARF